MLLVATFKVSFNHPCVCRNKAKFTDSVTQQVLESLLRHTQGDWNFFLHICFISCTLIIELI